MTRKKLGSFVRPESYEVLLILDLVAYWKCAFYVTDKFCEI